FWNIHALLHHHYQKPDVENLIRRRTLDARLLFQQLAKLDLDRWYIHSVDMVAPDAIPAEIRFPAGPPIPGQVYRRHPCEAKQYSYYPVTGYFSLLFEDREQALLALLRELGATKVAIARPTNPATNSDAVPNSGTPQPKIYQYAKQVRPPVKSIDAQKHQWLAYEPSWQSVIHKRIHTSVASIQLDFDLDVMGLLRDQIQTIVQLMPELDSMTLPDNYEEVLLAQVLQSRSVQVDFGA
ncbi:MAG: hypothetical protein AAFQ89_24610, partial [Cyanobacteria bacterium J06626_18]